MRPPTLLAALLLSACAAVPAAAPSATPPPAATTSPATAAPPSPSARPREQTPVPAPTAIALPRCDPPTTTLGTLALVRLCAPGATILVDELLSDADAAAVVAQVADDLAAVQREFGWTLRGAAVIDVYATTERYAAGLGAAFGYAPATAAFVAESSVAFFEPSLRRIAVRWEAVRDRRPIAAIRHELTHLVTLEACAPRCDLVPAWLNEGAARLAEALIPGGEWRAMRVRYEAASMAATGTLLPLAALVTQPQWNSLTDWVGYYKYQQAARVTELLREDIGEGAIARLYARIRAGDDVSRAYATLTGRSFDAFQRGLAGRVLAVSPRPRGIATVEQGADTVGLLVWGLPPDAKVNVRVTSEGVDELREITVSPQGASYDTIGRTFPSGTYTITAVSGDTGLVATATKRVGRAARSAPAP